MGLMGRKEGSVPGGGGIDDGTRAKASAVRAGRSVSRFIVIADMRCSYRRALEVADGRLS